MQIQAKFDTTWAREAAEGIAFAQAWQAACAHLSQFTTVETVSPQCHPLMLYASHNGEDRFIPVTIVPHKPSDASNAVLQAVQQSLAQQPCADCPRPVALVQYTWSLYTHEFVQAQL